MSGTSVQGHELVLAHLESSILSGELRVGMQLPPERKLAEQLGVSRGAVREVIRRLQAQGVVESMPGHGRGTRITNAQGEALASMFRLHLATANLAMCDLISTRIALEGATAAMAARNWEEEGLAQLEALVKQMEETTDLPSFNVIDTRFHIMVATIANNPLIGHLTAAIREAMRQPILSASNRMEEWSSFRLKLVDQHREIFDAISARDDEAATRRMIRHIHTASRALDLDSQEGATC